MRVGDEWLGIVDDEPVVIERKADESVGAFGEEAPSNGIDGWIEEENPGEQQGRRQPKPGHPPFAADQSNQPWARQPITEPLAGPSRLPFSRSPCYGLAPAGKAASIPLKISSRSPPLR